ncbi:MAG TPA: TIM barrel protein, partial [Burkholderiales bacterium]|nr:TIM barrel protein [Burkholderiales bacterium]
MNTATVRKQWTLAEAIDGCARHGIRGISPWRDQVAQMGLSHAKKSIREKSLVVTGLCRGGFFTAKDWRDDNRRAIEEAHELGAQCLVLVVGGLLPGSKDLLLSRERIKDGIAAILPEAKKAGIPLA